MSQASSKNGMRQPNIIFIIVDDMGWADLGCYGQTAYRTPHLDQLAADGIRFTDAYSGCALCAPARSTLMTGLHMGHTPVRGNTGGIPIPGDTYTTAALLEQAGYAVGGFGKWGLGDLDTGGVPEKHGFDRFFGYYHQIHAHYYYPDYLIDTGRKVPLPGNAGFYADNLPRELAIPDVENGYQRQFSHAEITCRMFEWIRMHKDVPFFCYAPWTVPHARYEIPESDLAWQAVKDKPWPPKVKGHAAFNLLIDRQIGELVTLLQELDIEEQTVLFFCSDNGASGRHEGTLDSSGPLRAEKGSMYEGGLRVPFIVRWPGHILAGQVSDLCTYFPDMMPTFAELAQSRERVPADIDGISIVPTLVGEGHQSAHEYLYWENPEYRWGSREYTGRIAQAVLHGNWKLVRQSTDDPWELYRLDRDLSEQQNLATQYPEVVRQIDAWVQANRDEMPPQIEPEKPTGRVYR